MVGRRPRPGREACSSRSESAPLGRAACRPPGRASGVVGVPVDVVADVEVEVAVVIEVGEGGRGRPVAIARPGRTASVASSNVPSPAVPIQGIRLPSGDEQVGMTVVVDVADGHAVAIASGHPGDPARTGRVLEGAVAAVAEQPVPRARAGRVGGEGPPLDGEDVEPAVAVEVDQANAAGGRLRELELRRPAVLESEPQARRRGIVDERDGRAGRVGGAGRPGGTGRPRRAGRQQRRQPIGERPRRRGRLGGEPRDSIQPLDGLAVVGPGPAEERPPAFGLGPAAERLGQLGQLGEPVGRGPGRRGAADSDPCSRRGRPCGGGAPPPAPCGPPPRRGPPGPRRPPGRRGRSRSAARACGTGPRRRGDGRRARPGGRAPRIRAGRRRALPPAP